MYLSKPRWARLLLISLSVFGLTPSGAFAQSESELTSPAPILLSDSKSIRALALPSRSLARLELPSRGSARAFPYNSTVVIFATNISLMNGEGANAFRVYVEDVNGRKFRFPVLELQPVDKLSGTDKVYALTVQIRDEAGFWAPPEDSGDVFMAVTWRPQRPASFWNRAFRSGSTPTRRRGW